MAAKDTSNPEGSLPSEGWVSSIIIRIALGSREFVPIVEFPKISLDPSKIRDRWGLAALGLIVWLLIGYAVLKATTLHIAISLTVLVLTLILLALVLALSFSTGQTQLPRASANIAAGRNPSPTQQKLNPQEIKYLHELVQLSQRPEIQEMLQEKFRGDKK